MPTNLAHQGEMVFNFVHHVRILVHDADEMVQYMEQNFAMTPVKVQVYESRGHEKRHLCEAWLSS